MGYRFSLEEANALAWLLGNRKTGSLTPWEVTEQDQGDHNENISGIAVPDLLHSLEKGFRSTKKGEERFYNLIHEAQRKWDRGCSPQVVFAGIRRHLSQRPWIALIVPSGINPDEDTLLCSNDFLQDLIYKNPAGPGLILQLDSPPSRRIDLATPFPAFRKAIADCHLWPGLLVWTHGSSAFFGAGGTDMDPRVFINDVIAKLDIETKDSWRYGPFGGMFTKPFDVNEFSKRYRFNRADLSKREDQTLTIIQLSDLHIGSNVASARMTRVDGIMDQLGKEYGWGQNVLPVLSGDLIDSPSDGNWGTATSFVRSIERRFVNKCFYIRGNHDCREQGFGSRSTSLGGYVQPDRLRWFDMQRVVVVGFDSCDGGNLAAGTVSPNQLDVLGHELDEDDRAKEYVHVGIVHHHPMSVPIPDWLKHRRFFKFIDPYHAPTVRLDEADRLLDFVNIRRFGALLHGHKHIPRETQTSKGVPVFGAGSATGMIETVQGRRLISINVLTVNGHTGMVGCRFHLEDTYGGGKAYEHEYVVRA